MYEGVFCPLTFTFLTGVTRKPHPTIYYTYTHTHTHWVGLLGSCLWAYGRVTLKFACSATISKLEVSSFAISNYTKCFDLWELPSQTPEWAWLVCPGQPLRSPSPQ